MVFAIFPPPGAGLKRPKSGGVAQIIFQPRMARNPWLYSFRKFLPQAFDDRGPHAGFPRKMRPIPCCALHFIEDLPPGSHPKRASEGFQILEARGPVPADAHGVCAETVDARAVREVERGRKFPFSARIQKKSCVLGMVVAVSRNDVEREPTKDFLHLAEISRKLQGRPGPIFIRPGKTLRESRGLPPPFAKWLWCQFFNGAHGKRLEKPVKLVPPPQCNRQAIQPLQRNPASEFKELVGRKFHTGAISYFLLAPSLVQTQATNSPISYP